jgi:hypothetical protein
MQNEARVTAKQAGGVDAQRQIAVDALRGVPLAARLRLLIVPKVSH